MRTCDGCRFCCWSFNVDIPDEILPELTEPKKELHHCRYECDKGCAIHEKPEQTDVCRLFKCPYLFGEDVHKPDTFKEVLKEVSGNMGNYVPAIPTYVPINAAINLIRESRSLLAFILISDKWGRWIQTVLPLDKNPDGTWGATEEMKEAWTKLADLKMEEEIVL